MWNRIFLGCQCVASSRAPDGLARFRRGRCGVPFLVMDDTSAEQMTGAVVHLDKPNLQSN